MVFHIAISLGKFKSLIKSSDGEDRKKEIYAY